MTHAPQTVTIYLTQHGRTWLNELDRVQGWSDSPLTTAGKEDAVRLGAALSDADMTIDAAYSADMVRHRETAETVLAVMGVDIPVTVTPNLREMSFGGFEGGPNRVMYDAVLAQANVDSLAGLEERVDGESVLLKLFESLEEANPVPTMPTETAREVAARVLQEFEDIVAEAGTRGMRMCSLSPAGSPSWLCCMLWDIRSTKRSRTLRYPRSSTQPGSGLSKG